MRAGVVAQFAHAADLAGPDVDKLRGLVADRVSELTGDSCTISLEPHHGAAPGDPDDRLVVAPLVAGGRGIGTLTVSRSPGGRPYTREDQGFVRELADLAALVLDHARLQAELGRVERLAAAGQVAAGVAHDVNNIVTVIKLYAELLEADCKLDGVGQERLHAMRTQADRAVSLAWQVLDIAHRQALRPVEVDLVPFLRELREIVGRMLRPGVVFAVEADRPCVPVQADPSRLQQILMNLVANANQAMPRGGELTIRVRSGEGSQVRLEVADTGEGIPADVLPRVFDAFYSTKPPGRGSGLGLTQVRALVAEHGGQVSIRSTVGEGTVVTVGLPVAPPGSVAPGRGRDPSPLRGRGERILVVEDDPGLRAALLDVLESVGYRAEAVADGEEALTWLAQPGHDVRAVVSDVAMAGVGGEGLARRMALTWPDVPIVLTTSPLGAPVSGDGSEDGQGRVFHLAKPFSTERLARALRAALA